MKSGWREPSSPVDAEADCAREVRTDLDPDITTFPMCFASIEPGVDPSDSSGSSFGPGRPRLSNPLIPVAPIVPGEKSKPRADLSDCVPDPRCTVCSRKPQPESERDPRHCRGNRGMGFHQANSGAPGTRETKKPPSPDGGGGSVSIQRRPDGSGLVGARAGITSPACHPFRPCRPCRACHRHHRRSSAPACRRSGRPS